MKDRCNARTRSGGNCRRWPLAGGTRCKLHGGASPRAKAAAKRRLVEADARAALAYEGLAPIGDPVEHLAKVATEVSAMKEALAARVNALDSPTYDFMGQSKTRAEVELFNSTIDRLIRVLEILSKHDLDARLVRVQEDQGRLFQYLVAGIVSELALTSDQTAQLPEVMTKWLRRTAEGIPSNVLPPA